MIYKSQDDPGWSLGNSHHHNTPTQPNTQRVTTSHPHSILQTERERGRQVRERGRQVRERDRQRERDRLERGAG